MPSVERYQRQKAEAAERQTTPFLLRKKQAAERYPDASARALAGKAGAGERSLAERRAASEWTVTVFVESPEGPRRRTLRVPLTDSQRGGRYDADLKRLKSGRITADEFERRWRRAKPIGGYRLVSNPRTALALDATTAREDWVFESGSQRAQRRRRAR
jgi:hypothetical protein